MKLSVLWILAGFSGILSISSCAPSRDVYGHSVYRAAMTPATGSTQTTVVVNPVIVADEKVDTITEQDIARFETELRTIMGSDATALSTPRRQKPPVENTQPAMNAGVNSTDAKFYVITGSFGSVENAQAQKEILTADGHQAGIIAGTMGMFRVYAFAGNNRTEAEKQLKIIRDFYPEAWIFVNNK
ncbi:MAG: SPOR domain-containing protein [Prevotellaceae bacterium]|jgi:cell division septation protein DedD|nr:SPOR domain-containing protein [Prevotellaceae bacterium]